MTGGGVFWAEGATALVCWPREDTRRRGGPDPGRMPRGRRIGHAGHKARGFFLAVRPASVRRLRRGDDSSFLARDGNSFLASRGYGCVVTVLQSVQFL
ncbi:hypothetical protein GUJ93_ZPchr0002g25476 [Zizania palustris]|uniref:Uncharacterized protein n=1 Tax=Zizania palustris TaxID=103762 RepID=A0A8J5S2F3_ZIZPA|nr:hypothetical protein GUJ93_ZPchr0002g25476 [Zizania palustris]